MSATAEAATWLARRTWNRPTWTAAELEGAKDGRTVSVVLPALNEAGTVGAVIGLVAVVVVSITRTWTPTIDPAVLLAAPAIGTITGALAGIAPAIKAARTPPADTLRG